MWESTCMCGRHQLQYTYKDFWQVAVEIKKKIFLERESLETKWSQSLNKYIKFATSLCKFQWAHMFSSHSTEKSGSKKTRLFQSFCCESMQAEGLLGCFIKLSARFGSNGRGGGSYRKFLNLKTLQVWLYERAGEQRTPVCPAGCCGIWDRCRTRKRCEWPVGTRPVCWRVAAYIC